MCEALTWWPHHCHGHSKTAYLVFFFYLVSSLRRWLPRSVPRIVGFILLLFDLGFLFDFASRWLGKQRPNERIDCHKRNICLPIAEPSSADLERALSLSLSLSLSFFLSLSSLLFFFLYPTHSFVVTDFLFRFCSHVHGLYLVLPSFSGL